MNEIDLSRAEWHKSSYSSQDGNCVEVATNMPGMVAVCDSKGSPGAHTGRLQPRLAVVCSSDQERVTVAPCPGLAHRDTVGAGQAPSKWVRTRKFPENFSS
jgi:uncharacterized protein DUF397